MEEAIFFDNVESGILEDFFWGPLHPGFGNDAPTATAINYLRQQSSDGDNELSTAHVIDVVMVEAEPMNIIGEEDEDEDEELFHKQAQLKSASVIKNHGDSGVGLVLCTDEDGRTRISATTPSGLLRNAPFQRGDELVSVNGRSCYTMSKTAIANLLRRLTGTITIVARNTYGDRRIVESMIEKPSPSSLAGIALRGHEVSGLKVSKVSESGCFSDSMLLNAGDRLLSVNNIQCKSLSTQAAVDIIRNAPRHVTVRVAKAQDSMPSATVEAIITQNIFRVSPHKRAEYVSMTFIKRECEDRVALGIRSDTRGRLVISSLGSHGDVLYGSPLRVGDRLLSVNGNSCSSLSRHEALTLLKETVGVVTIVARNDDGDAFRVESMVEKLNPNEPVGIAMKRNRRGTLEISRISQGGIFIHSLMNPGDRVLSVNSIPCQLMGTPEVVGIIRQSKRFVRMVVEPHYATGVVVSAS